MNAASPDPIQTYTDTPSTPKLVLPKHACDSHVHVFGPRVRFPYAPHLKVTPAEASKEKLFALHQKMGISRCVIVQSVTHGTDNSVVQDAIAAGAGRYLGVALIDLPATTQQLKQLAQGGFRAVRFHFMRHINSGPSIGDIMRLTHQLAEVGMHLQVHFESSLIHSLGPQLLTSAVPVVIDHMARVDATLGQNHADFQALLNLLENPQMHVKVSGIDRIESASRAGSGYPLGVQLAATLVSTFPQQCVWGLDWPHPNHTHIPDDGELVDALVRIAPTPHLLQQLLVHNPQSLYRFAH